MTPAPSLDVWFGLAGVLAAGMVAVVAAAAVTARIVRGAAWRRTVWQVAMAAMLVLVAVEMTGVGRGVASWLTPGRSRDAPAPVLDAVTRAVPVASAYHEAAAAQPRDESAPVAAPVAASRTVMGDPPASPESATVAAAGEGGESLTVGWWPGAVWLIGAVVVLGRVVAARVFLVVFRLRHRAVADGDLVGRVRTIARRLGMRRGVRVVESGRLTAPIAFGMVRPTIGLPRAFTSEFSIDQQNAVLGHELAHLAWCDPAWSLVADVATVALWWHPAAWWARRRLQTASETAADEGCVVVTRGPQLLAASLVELGKRLVRPRAAAWLGVGGVGFRSGLGHRVERLLRLDSRPRRPSRFGMWCLRVTGPLALLCVALLCTAWARPAHTREGDPEMKALSTMWKHSIAGAVVLAALNAGPHPALADGEGGERREVRREEGGERGEARREEGGERREVRREEGEEDREVPRREEAERRKGEKVRREGESRREVDGRPVREREGERREGEGRKEQAEGRRDQPRREGERDEREVHKAKLLERIKGLERLKALAVKAKDEKAVVFVGKLIAEAREQLHKIARDIERRRAGREGEGERPRGGDRERGEGERREVDGQKVRRGEGDREKRAGEGPRVREGDREKREAGGRKDADR